MSNTHMEQTAPAVNATAGDFARVVVDISEVDVLEELEDATRYKACASASVESSLDITIEVARVIAEALRFMAFKIEDQALADLAEQDGAQIN
jgi:hypothetical protein